MTIRKKISDARDSAANALFTASLKRGPKTAAAANAVCGVFLGGRFVRCEDPNCPDPRHEHDR